MREHGRFASQTDRQDSQSVKRLSSYQSDNFATGLN